MASQLFANPKVLTISGAVLTLLGMIPGMPNLVFLTIGLISLYGAYKSSTFEAEAQSEPVEPPPQTSEVAEELGWEDVGAIDALGLEVGYRLISLVDNKQGGPLMARIRGIRKSLTRDLGFLIPPVHIRDNLELTPGGYRISIHGVPVAESEIHTGKELANKPG